MLAHLLAVHAAGATRGLGLLLSLGQTTCHLQAIEVSDSGATSR
jgi:hypothetical protein